MEWTTLCFVMSFLMTITILIIIANLLIVNDELVYFLFLFIFNSFFANFLFVFYILGVYIMGIVDRITSKTDLKLAQIERELGFGNGTMRKWDISFPSFDKVVAVADLINVSVDYLAGRENKKIEPTFLAYSGNEKVDSIIKTLLNSSIDDDDLKIIEVVLDKYKK